MSSRRVEEVDTNGRRRVTILEEEPAVQATDQEVAGEEEVIQTHPDTWNVARGWVRTFGAFVAVAFAVIETLLMFRFGFLLAGANPSNGFVDFIYDITGGMVEPFKNIISTSSVGDDGVFEPASLIALVVYAAVALLLTMLLWAASSAPSGSGDRAVTTRSRRRMREIRGE
jgi:hypothetical protein